MHAGSGPVIRVGALVAVAWGGGTNRPSGGSYWIELECRVPDVAPIHDFDAFQQRVARRLLERYDHRELTATDLVPQAFLREVVRDFSAEVAEQGFELLSVTMRDPRMWSLTIPA
ncbi:MAG: hypothetical protein D6761_03030 [Candidatus Dadabacteria bacterium]|nr:MAG: hypothetical protein D6761_03030 [Candidatus Dadabacteria bacterium]